MIHKKAEHTDKVSNCWNFSTGACIYGETKCWFIHAGQSQVPEIKCKLCDENFFGRRDLQQHKKNLHPHTILFCRNIMNGGQCIYGKHCLFKHNENETSERNEIKNFENSEVGQKNI